jgi:hypothetical protein
MNNFNKQASEMVGDGQSPNVFFVTIGNNTFLMSSNFNEAYTVWLSLPIDLDTTLEDRQYGVICSNETGEDYKGFRKYDDSVRFLKGI